MTDNAQDITAMTATDLAELLRVTPRRIRQLAEEGRLRRRGRGKFDVRHAIHGATGAEILGQDQRRNIAADVVVAVGWLAAIADAPAEGDNFKVWIDICAEWGCRTPRLWACSSLAHRCWATARRNLKET